MAELFDLMPPGGPLLQLCLHAVQHSPVTCVCVMCVMWFGVCGVV